MIYLRLFYEFFKVGLFAVGGGMATLPFLYDMAGRTGWFTASQIADMLAVSESTPGPIGVNMSTYVGFTTCESAGYAASILGAVIATLGLVTPSVIVILLVAHALKAFRQNKYVDAVFYGLRPCSVGLIAAAGVLVVKVAFFNSDIYGASQNLFAACNWKGILLAAVLIVLTRYVKQTKNLHPIIFIAASALVGIVFNF